MEVAIVTEDLEVRYDDKVALSGVSLSIPVGSSLAVVGSNGSGKSTLLGALAGLNRPSAGTAWVIDDQPAFVLQSTEVDDGLPITALDAVKLARYPTLGMFRRFGPSDTEAVHTAIARMDATDLTNIPLQQLSGGQRQRILVAQGLAQESQVLLLDEPMTGLDVTSRATVLDVIKQELASHRTVVMTTHSLADARHCDFALLLATKPIAFGPPDEVLIETNLRRTFEHAAVLQVGDDFVVDDHHVH